MKHPKNDTNCTAGKKLKRFKVDNVTFYRCVFKRSHWTHIPKDRNCKKPGFVKRCKVDKFTGKNVCRCIPLGPVPRPGKDIVYEEGKERPCKKNGVCIYRPPKPVKKTTVVEYAVGLF